jgi:hypothetical protein
MTNKKFFVGMAVLLSVSLFFIGCPTEADTETVRVTNTVAKAGDPVGLQALLDDPDVPAVTYLGVLAIADGEVIVPPGKTLIAADGVTLSTGTFVVAGTLELGADGAITPSGAGNVIGSTALLEKVVDQNSVVKVEIQDGSETIDLTETIVAVQGPITIGSSVTSENNIVNTALSGKTLYVAGNVTASAAINPAPTAINVLGNVSVTADQSTAVVWKIQGNLDAQKLPTTGNATLTVGGNANFADGLTTGTGLFKIGKNLTVASGKVTSLGGNLTVGDAASFGGTLGNTAASVATFNGATTVTGAVTTGTGGLTIAGKGAVTLAEEPVLTNGLTVTNTAGVTFSSAFELTASKSITASAGKVIFGTGAHSVTITKGTLTSNTVGLATVAADGVVTLPFSTNGASLVLANEGSVAIAGTGKVASPGLEISGAGTVVTSTGASTIAAASAATTTLLTTNVADNGIQIGTAANGVALLAVGSDAMTYTFTKATTSGAVTIVGAFITAPADSAAGAIIAATTEDKAKIVLGTASGGIKIGKGDHGGKLSIAYSGGGSKIGPFAGGSHANGNLPAAVGLAATDEQDAGEKILLGAFASSYSTAGAAVTAFGIKGTGDAEINSNIVLVETAN